MNEQSAVVGILDKVKEITDGGGWKGTFMRFVMYFILPLIVLISLAYLAWFMFKVSRRPTVTTDGQASNQSVPYVNQTGGQVTSVNVNGTAAPDTDAETFRKLQERLKGIYRL